MTKYRLTQLLGDECTERRVIGAFTEPNYLNTHIVA